MLEPLEEAYKELQKQLQKARIMALSARKSAKGVSNQRKIEKTSKTECETVQQTLSTSSQGMKNAVKGKFGEKLTEIFEKQEGELVDF